VPVLAQEHRRAIAILLSGGSFDQAAEACNVSMRGGKTGTLQIKSVIYMTWGIMARPKSYPDALPHHGHLKVPRG
jgi:hypothetical protein